MPLFLTPYEYTPVLLEATYEAAFAGVPDVWRELLETQDKKSKKTIHRSIDFSKLRSTRHVTPHHCRSSLPGRTADCPVSRQSSGKSPRKGPGKIHHQAQGTRSGRFGQV